MSVGQLMAGDQQPLTGVQAVMLRKYRSLYPRERHAFLGALNRVVDGQSVQNSGVEMLVELGVPLQIARRKMRQVVKQSSDWRRNLD